MTRHPMSRRLPSRAAIHTAALAAVAALLLVPTPALRAAPALGVSGDGVPDYFYDSTTGDLRFFFDGFTPVDNGGSPSFINTLSVQSAGNKLLFANANPVISTGTAATLTSSRIASAINTNPGYTDGFDLGNILPAGLATNTLLTDLTLKFQSFNGGNLKSANLVLTSPLGTPTNNWSPATPTTAKK